MNRWIIFILSGIIILTTLIVDPLIHHSFTAPKHHFFIISIPLLLSVIFWRRKSTVLSFLGIIFLLRIAWLSVANPEWVLHTGNDSFLLFISLLLLIFAASQLNRDKLADYFLISLFLVGILQAMVGFWQLHIYVPDPATPIKTPVLGTLGSSNGVGLLLVIALLSGLYLLFYFKGKGKWLASGGLIVLLGGLILSESRGAVLALFVSLASIVFLSLHALDNKWTNYLREKKKLILAIILPGLLLLGLALYQLNPASSLGRLMIWEITFEMIQDHPIFGIGQGNYSVEYLNYQAEFFKDPDHETLMHKAANIKQAHNEFLQAFAEGGFLGGLLFTALWTIPIYFVLKKTWQSKNIDLSLVVITGIHIVIVFHALVDSPLHIFPIAVIGYVNMSMMFPLGYEFQLNRVGKYSILFLFSVYTAYVGYRSVHIYPGYQDWKKGIDLAKEQQWEAAVYNYQKAQNRFQKKGELEYNLGSAMVFNEQFTRGIYYLNQAKQDFNDRNIYLSESYGYLQLEKFQKAKESALKALSMFPDHLAPHLLLGEIYYELGMIDQSKESLKKCIELDTRIISDEVLQIRSDAIKFWKFNIGTLGNEK